MTEEPPYTGPESRKEHRRKNNARRTMIRYEPGKEDRRSGKDRRKTNKDIWKDRDF
ncbi:MAG: hypothetical protein KAR30_05375 [Gammaproteobacteria bacterium]|nr:hypothetical protein [Gammaproteobacteria bacterium]